MIYVFRKNDNYQLIKYELRVTNFELWVMGYGEGKGEIDLLGREDDLGGRKKIRASERFNFGCPEGL